MNEIRDTLATAREDVAWKCRIQGMTQVEIVSEIDKAGLGKVSRQAVGAMLNRTEDRIYKELVQRVGQMKAFQTSALMHLYREACQAWAKSKEPDKQVRESKNGNSKQTMATISDSDGDPRLLAQALAALADLRKVWGLDSAIKIAPTMPSGDEPYQLEAKQLQARLDLLSVEELKFLQSIYEKMDQADVGRVDATQQLAGTACLADDEIPEDGRDESSGDGMQSNSEDC